MYKVILYNKNSFVQWNRLYIQPWSFLIEYNIITILRINIFSPLDQSKVIFDIQSMEMFFKVCRPDKKYFLSLCLELVCKENKSQFKFYSDMQIKNMDLVVSLITRPLGSCMCLLYARCSVRNKRGEWKEQGSSFWQEL